MSERIGATVAEAAGSHSTYVLSRRRLRVDQAGCARRSTGNRRLGRPLVWPAGLWVLPANLAQPLEDSCRPSPEPNPLPPMSSPGERKHLQLDTRRAIALSLAGKQLHWNTYRREFRDPPSLGRRSRRMAGARGCLRSVRSRWALPVTVMRQQFSSLDLDRSNLASSRQDARSSACARSFGKWPSGSGSAANSSSTWTPLGAVVVDVCRKLEEQLWMMRAQLSD